MEPEVLPEQGDNDGWLALVTEDATTLCTTVKAAAAAGVPDGLMLPALLAVFREQGMIPENMGGLLGGLLG